MPTAPPKKKAPPKKVRPKELFLARNSEISTFKDCRLKWKWAYWDELKSKDQGPALTFGSIAHAAWERWYIPGKKRGQHPAEAFVEVYSEYLKDHDELMMAIGDEVYGADDVGVEMMTNYVDEYGKDPNIEVIAPEMVFQVDVYDPVTGRYLFTYTGIIDGVIRWIPTGKIGFLEHKTGTGLTPFGAPETLDDQGGGYWTFAPDFLVHQGIIKKKSDLDFILYNRARKAFKDARPVNEKGQSLNKNGTVSKVQPMPLFRRSWMLRAEGDRVEVFKRVKDATREMRMLRDGIPMPDGEPLGIYKNPDKHCNWCQFRDMCEVHESGGDWQALRDYGFVKWEPYTTHAIKRDEEL